MGRLEKRRADLDKAKGQVLAILGACKELEDSIKALSDGKMNEARDPGFKAVEPEKVEAP